MKRISFKDNTERNFVCEKCGAEVEGSGYTNHCPECLWSKHVDVFPGDRNEKCGGMMEPIDSESKNGELRVKHKCTKCGFERWCLLNKEDSLEIVPALIAKSEKL